MLEIDLDTLERASRGDIDAFEQVYRSACGFVYNVAFRITRNSADAQEVTQDVFMKIHRSLNGFQFRSAFKTWVYRITVNVAINRYRVSSRERNRHVDYDNLIENIPDGRSTAEGVLRKEDQEKLNGFLDNLSAEHKACLLLREIEGLSYQEMAEVLRIPVNTVRSRLKRAREALLEEGRKGARNDAL